MEKEATGSIGFSNHVLSIPNRGGEDWLDFPLRACQAFSRIGSETSIDSGARILMTVSRDNSKVIYQGIKASGVRFLTAMPETWLLYLLQLADNDDEMTLIEVAKEEEAI